MKLFDLSEKEIEETLRKRSLEICVVGLGRIGLPTAAIFADSGFKVTGVDINGQVIDDINKGRCRFQDEPELKELLSKARKKGDFRAEHDLSSAIAKADMVIVCVPTPVNDSKAPDFAAIINSSMQIAESLKAGAVVVVESTVSPGTVENTIVPLIEEKSGLKAGKDFGVASCPERANPSETLAQMKTLPRIVGGIDSRSTDLVASIYSHVLGVDIVKASNPKTANAVKLTENIFRDVNIALMNEFAILYEKLGIDTIEVIKACATKYNFVPHYPSAGVGGPCLPANAYYIIDEGIKVGYIPHLIRMAREINDRMPDHVVMLVMEALNDAGKVVSKSKIALLGVSYKAGIHDLQMTPFKRVHSSLKAMGASVEIYDPMFKGEEVFGTMVARNLREATNGADCIIIGTAHKEFKNLKLNEVYEACIKPAALVDTQNIISPEDARKHGFYYLGVGRRIAPLSGE